LLVKIIGLSLLEEKVDKKCMVKVEYSQLKDLLREKDIFIIDQVRQQEIFNYRKKCKVTIINSFWQKHSYK
jgi:hypothetical protein